MYCWLVLLAAFALAVPVAIADDTDKDPYLWLEDVTGEKALAWVKEQNAKSIAELTKSPEFKALDERLLKILDSKERIPFVSKRGELYYNFWRDEKNKRGLWRRTTLDEYRKARAEVGDRARPRRAGRGREGELGLARAPTASSPTYERCLVSLSRGGADAAVVREFDPKTKAFVEGRLHAARGQERRRLEGPRHASSSAPTSAPAR